MRLVFSTSRRVLPVLLILVIIFGATSLYYGLAFASESKRVGELQNTVSELQNQISVSNPEVAVDYGGNGSIPQFSPVAVYESSNESVVTVEGSRVVVVETLFGPQQGVESVLGSGFVVSGSTSDYVVTNFHVVDGTVNETVTFWNGDSFPARTIGTDAYSDLAGGCGLSTVMH